MEKGESRGWLSNPLWPSFAALDRQLHWEVKIETGEDVDAGGRSDRCAGVGLCTDGSGGAGGLGAARGHCVGHLGGAAHLCGLGHGPGQSFRRCSGPQSRQPAAAAVRRGAGSGGRVLGARVPGPGPAGAHAGDSGQGAGVAGGPGPGDELLPDVVRRGDQLVRGDQPGQDRRRAGGGAAGDGGRRAGPRAPGNAIAVRGARAATRARGLERGRLEWLGHCAVSLRVGQGPAAGEPPPAVAGPLHVVRGAPGDSADEHDRRGPGGYAGAGGGLQ